MIFEGPGKAIFTNSERSQFGVVLLLPIRKGPNFANPGRPQFCQSGRVPTLPIRKGPNFCQSGRVLQFVNPEGSQNYHF